MFKYRFIKSFWFSKLTYEPKNALDKYGKVGSRPKHVQHHLKATKFVVQIALYISMTYDELNAIDNQSLLSIHVYVVKNWLGILIFLSFDIIKLVKMGEPLFTQKNDV